MNFKFDVCGFEHHHVHTFFSTLDGYQSPLEAANKIAKNNQRFLVMSDHGMMSGIPQQIKACHEVSEEYKQKDKIKPVFACLPKGHFIHTSNGVKDISDVVVGDIVLTHKGRFKKVVNVFKRHHKGIVYNVLLSGHSKKTLRLTGEHPVLVFDGNKRDWVLAKNIVCGRKHKGNGIKNHLSYVCFPKIKHNDHFGNFSFNLIDYQNDPLIKLNHLNVLEKKKIGYRKTWPYLPRTLILDEKLAYFLGLFAAEGSFGSNYRSGKKTLDGSARLTLNISEVDYANFVKDYLKSIGISTNTYMFPHRGSMDVCFSCVPFVFFLSKIIGVGFKNKRIPFEILSSNLSIQKSFLNGLLAGDGKKINRTNKQNTLKICSPHLAWQSRIILSNLGYWSSIYTRQPKMGTNHSVCYFLPIQYNDQKSYPRYLSDDDYVYKPIQKVFQEEIDEFVYNFEVEDDNSYVSDFILHNCELYVNNDQPFFRRSEDYKHYAENLSLDDKLKLKRSYHLLAIASNNVGYANLVKLCTLGWSHGYGGFPRRPRLTYKQLTEHKEGIIFSSCCCLSEIAAAFDEGGEEAGEDMLLRYWKMFGENFYLELMLLDFKKQKPYDAFLIKMHDKYHIPLTITNDAHYCEQSDAKYQTYMLLTRGKKKIADLEKAAAIDPDGDQFELYDKNLWMKSENDMNEKWLSDYQDIIPYELFCDAKRNTVKICERASDVTLDRSIKLPKIPDADAKLKEAVMRGFKWRGLPANDQRYVSQLRKEYELITQKDFSSYFLIKKMMTDEARRICPEILGWGTGEEAIGPGRGCLSGDSLIILKDNVIKPIKDVAVDDLVLNRDGKFRKVVRKFEYNCSEDLYEITTTEDAEHPLKLTGDHKVYVSVEQSMGWRRADSLSVGDIAFKPSAETFKTSFFVPIISIKKVKNPTNKVYDIQIEGDDEHNYCTTSCLVHNSAVSFLTCYVLGITDVNPVYHNLIPERFLSSARGGKMAKLLFSKEPDYKGLSLRGAKYLVE